MSAPRKGVGTAGRPSRGRDFFVESRKRDGLQSWCRACKAESSRRWRAQNREVYNARRRVDPYPPRTCATCGQVFIPVRVDQRYCCRWCREHRYLTRAGGVSGTQVVGENQASCDLRVPAARRPPASRPRRKRPQSAP